jgi:hypothetical protein
VFIEYYLRLKHSEAGRFREFLEKAGLRDAGSETTEWEHNEYFDFF